MKIIYKVYACWFGEVEFFFDTKGTLLHYWWMSDAVWRGEYMNPLMEALGVKVEHAEANDPRFVAKVKEILAEMGASEEDFDEGV
jgi:hypothetical protein